MRAAVLYEPNTPLRIEHFELPETGPTHVRVTLVTSGVCHSDWHVIKGEWPHIPTPSMLGREGAGIVEEVGSAVPRRRGRRPRRAVLEAQLRPLRDVPEGLPEPL